MTRSPLWWVLGLLAFAGEIALVAGLAAVVHDLAGGGLGGVTGGMFAALALIAAWGRWMAPRAARRLPTVPRATVAAALAAAIAALWWWAGSGAAAVAFAVLAVVLAVTQVALADDPGRADTSPPPSVTGSTGGQPTPGD